MGTAFFPRWLKTGADEEFYVTVKGMQAGDGMTRWRLSGPNGEGPPIEVYLEHDRGIVLQKPGQGSVHVFDKKF